MDVKAIRISGYTFQKMDLPRFIIAMSLCALLDFYYRYGGKTQAIFLSGWKEASLGI